MTRGEPDEAGYTKFPRVLSQWDTLPIPLEGAFPSLPADQPCPAWSNQGRFGGSGHTDHTASM